MLHNHSIQLPLSQLMNAVAFFPLWTITVNMYKNVLPNNSIISENVSEFFLKFSKIVQEVVPPPQLDIPLLVKFDFFKPNCLDVIGSLAWLSVLPALTSRTKNLWEIISMKCFILIKQTYIIWRLCPSLLPAYWVKLKDFQTWNGGFEPL